MRQAPPKKPERGLRCQHLPVLSRGSVAWDVATDSVKAQWNCPSSVEPVSAVVELLGSTVVAMRSK